MFSLAGVRLIRCLLSAKSGPQTKSCASCPRWTFCSHLRIIREYGKGSMKNRWGGARLRRRGKRGRQERASRFTRFFSIGFSKMLIVPWQELLKELLDAGKIKARTKWKEVYPDITIDKRYLNLLGNPGSNPLELFWDVVDGLDQKLDEKVELVDNALKSGSEKRVYLNLVHFIIFWPFVRFFVAHRSPSLWSQLIHKKRSSRMLSSLRVQI